MAKRSSNQFQVFPAEGGFQAIRRESREHAEQLVMREILRPEFDQVTGELKGYRVLGAEMRKVDTDVRSIPSTAGISGPNPATHRVGEMELNCERSRTERMREDVRRQQPVPEDRVERIHAKVRVYAKIGPARGDILRVWPRKKSEQFSKE
jgi:hypothetical protein